LGFWTPIRNRLRPRQELVVHNGVDDPALPSARAPDPWGRVPEAQAPNHRLPAAYGGQPLTLDNRTSRVSEQRDLSKVKG
jgi:hypothetical protein